MKTLPDHFQLRRLLMGLCIVALVVLAVVVPAGCCMLLALLVPLGLVAATDARASWVADLCHVPVPLSAALPLFAGRAPPALA